MARESETIDRLYRRHRAELLRYLIREGADPDEAEDAVQTAFLDAYRALLAGGAPDRARPWLYAIARNARRRQFRRLGAREPASALDPELPAREPLRIGDLVDAVERLPESQRAALLLREIGGHSYPEIAERLDVTVASVQMLLFRARRALRAELGGEQRRRALLPLPGQQLASWISGTLDRVGPAGGTAAVLGSAVAAVAVAGSAAPVPRDDVAPLPRSRLPAHPAAAPARSAPALPSAPAPQPSRPATPSAVAPAAGVARAPRDVPPPRETAPAPAPAPRPPTAAPSAEADGGAETAPVPQAVTVPALPSVVPTLPETPPAATGSVSIPPLPIPAPDVTPPDVGVPESTVPDVDLP